MQEIFVIDDFYREPERVRQFALELDYENQSTPNYPGFQSTVPCLSEAVANKFATVVGGEIDWAWSRDQMGFFRYIYAGGKSRIKVHTDMNDWTVVVYLAPHCPANVGTRFYRHRATQLSGPPTATQMAQFGYTSFTDYEEKLIEKDTLVEAAWEVIDEVDYRFNRCIIFRADRRFHSHAEGYGYDPATARLTQNFFFNVKKEA